MDNGNIVSNIKLHIFKNTYDFWGAEHNGPPPSCQCCSSCGNHQGGGCPCSVVGVAVDDGCDCGVDVASVISDIVMAWGARQST